MFEEKLNIAKRTDSLSELQNEELTIQSGETIIIIGANGSGKTRLAVYIEEQLGEKAHRIAAHRALNLNPNVAKISEQIARQELIYGVSWATDISYRAQGRWQNKSSTYLLNDFDKLLQYLFAQQNNLAVANNQRFNQNLTITESETKLDKLRKVWEILLPYKKLHITADNIQVSSINNENERYSASEMSDGERAVFYILGQVLSANENSILIFDEPELHIHKSIITKLWDKVEEIRPDCAFIMITHDIEFAATRSAKKYVIRDYYPEHAWDIAAVPDSEFDEQTIALILGSRKPILFVEGGNTSLDIEIYRRCYPEWTVIPKGSCQAVIQSVSSLSKLNQDMPLLNMRYAGIVDRDKREESEIINLNSLGIKVLPVSEIENIFSLTAIAREILKIDGFCDTELDEKLIKYKEELLEFIKENLKNDKLDEFVVKQIQRHIDRYLKNIDLSGSNDTDKMKELLNLKFIDLTDKQIESWFSELKHEIKTHLSNNDIDKLLEIYENKGLLSKTASILRRTPKNEFEKSLMRQLKNQNNGLLQAIKQTLPNI